MFLDYTCDIIYYFSFYDISLSIMFPTSIHVAAKGSSLFLFYD